MIEQRIFDICNSRVDASLLKAQTHALCVDGTSASRKSSILGATGRSVRKVQREAHAVNTNTYFPSMIGYVASGILGQNTGEPHFNDRSYLNTLEWSVLWRIMDDYVSRFGNLYPDDRHPDIGKALCEYRRVFRDLGDSYFYRCLRDRMNGIAIIDSDTDRCDALRLARGEGADAERSRWKFYTALQNLMYAELYPNLCIDMDWFSEYDLDVVRDSVASWLVYLLDGVAARVTARVPVAAYRLPIPRHDFNLSNMTVHAYRSTGRVLCKTLIGLSSENENKGVALTLRDYMPAYLNVYESASSSSATTAAAAATPRFLDPREFNRSDYGEILVRAYPKSIDRPTVIVSTKSDDDSDRVVVAAVGNDDGRGPLDDDAVELASFANAFEDDNIA